MVIDTYEQVAAPAVQADALAIYRQQVREEQGEKIVRSKMSDTALAKPRAIKEQEKADAITGERFATALKCVIVNQENLKKLITRCNSSVPVTQLERRAEKLLWWTSAGFLLGREIDTICLINFFSELTADEAVMSEGKFSGVWNAPSAAKVKASRVNRGVIASEAPVYRPCKSGKKCLKFEKRRPAPANGSGAYCTLNCAAGDRARVKRALSGSGSSSFLN